MAESVDPQASDERFRWQALFQRSREPLFLLNAKRRILFVNQAWERLTGVRLHDVPEKRAHGLLCKRYKNIETAPLRALAAALSPPPEVLAGQVSQVRRLVSTGTVRRWWDVHFLPLHDPQGLLGILGKVTPLADVSPPAVAPLPEKLMALRERRAKHFRLDHLASEVPALRRVADQVRLAAQTLAPVLIVGEGGTGKHWLARTIHGQGVTRERAFVTLDCAGLPLAALTGTLLGVGGLARRAGIGTIYLRHLTALPREAQAQLSDWLTEPALVRPRVVASLSRDPVEEMAAGRLLEKLACSVGTLQIMVPPLRQRRADLPLLVQWLLDRANVDAARRVLGLAPEAWATFRSYAWPGNLRELAAVLTAAQDRAKGDTIQLADLPVYVQRSVQLEQLPGRSAERSLPLDQLLQQVERRLIVLALAAARGNKSQAAKLLSIWRPRLLRRMKELDIPDRGTAKP